MGASFLITLREGLEISLVLAILITYLVRTDRRDAIRSVWTGAAIAAAGCIVVGIVVNAAVGGLHGKAEPAVEGVIAVTACAVLSWMVFWMRRNARSLGGELRNRVDLATSAGAIVGIAFVAVVREGLETVLFLLSAKTEDATYKASDVVIGGLAGLALAALLGWIVYQGGNKLNLRVFFNVTGFLLLLFAAGLFGKAFHEFRELFGAESGWLVEPMWTVTSGPFASGNFYEFLNGFFGWASDPERVRVIAYFVYLVPALFLYLRRTRTAAPVASPDASPAELAEAAH